MAEHSLFHAIKAASRVYVPSRGRIIREFDRADQSQSSSIVRTVELRHRLTWGPSSKTLHRNGNPESRAVERYDFRATK
jgi:hypothetical protein